MRVLLVDDEKYWSHGFVKYLRLVERWDVTYEFSVKSAVETIRQAYKSSDTAFDVILLDVMMPPEGQYTQEDSEDGLQTGLLLAPRVFEETGSRACIVLLTARQDLAPRIGPEISGYILKTKTPGEIANEVRRIVAAKAAAKRTSSTLPRYEDRGSSGEGA